MKVPSREGDFKMNLNKSFKSYEIHWNLLFFCFFNPVIMPVLPKCYLLEDALRPYFRELFMKLFLNLFVVSESNKKVELGDYHI
jgi:hypothetical protein